MKKLLIAITGLLMISTTAIAQNQNGTEVPRANLTVRYTCQPTPFIIEQLTRAGIKKTHDLGTSDIGKYQEWRGIEDGVEVWVLILVAPNGFSCTVDTGYVGDPPASNKTPEESMDDKLDSFK